jgi:hypothetical protein
MSWSFDQAHGSVKRRTLCDEKMKFYLIVHHSFIDDFYKTESKDTASINSFYDSKYHTNSPLKKTIEADNRFEI